MFGKSSKKQQEKPAQRSFLRHILYRFLLLVGSLGSILAVGFSFAELSVSSATSPPPLLQVVVIVVVVVVIAIFLWTLFRFVKHLIKLFKSEHNSPARRELRRASLRALIDVVFAVLLLTPVAVVLYVIMTLTSLAPITEPVSDPFETIQENN